MTSQKFSIVIASMFLLGVAAWYGARLWTFGHLRAYFVVPLVLAVALVVSLVRGSESSRWLTGLFSAGYAYASFNLSFYANSKGIAGGAYVLPGVAFSLCFVLVFFSLVAGYLRKGNPLK